MNELDPTPLPARSLTEREVMETISSTVGETHFAQAFLASDLVLAIQKGLEETVRIAGWNITATRYGCLIITQI